jgi:hypothetical protein
MKQMACRPACHLSSQPVVAAKAKLVVIGGRRTVVMKALGRWRAGGNKSH